MCDACLRACCRECFSRAEQVQPLLQNHSRRVDSRPTFHLRESNHQATLRPLSPDSLQFILSPCRVAAEKRISNQLQVLATPSALPLLSCTCAASPSALASSSLPSFALTLKYTTRTRCSFYASVALTSLCSPLQWSALDSRINKLIRGSLWTPETWWCLQSCRCKYCGARACSSSFVSLSRPVLL